MNWLRRFRSSRYMSDTWLDQQRHREITQSAAIEGVCWNWSVFTRRFDEKTRTIEQWKQRYDSWRKTA